MTGIRRMCVGLALGGGVVRGLAHVGVLSELIRAGIPIDLVAGTSAGSIIGAAYCTGVSIERIRAFSEYFRWRRFARLVWPVRGWISFDKLARLMISEFGDLKFSDLKTPFAVIATDLGTGEAVTLRQGRIAPAVQASCSVPGFVTPVEIDGRLLGDGSLVNTVPVSVLREMGADYVIGVDIFSSALRSRLGPFGLGMTAIEILVRGAGGGIREADCLISPELAGMTYLRFSQRKDLIRLGAESARAQLDGIRSALSLPA
jgi:NTE family protein